ncbi:hypothetical protein MZH77_25905, partial [Escherichia coli]|nr:hypothetical protein [Escherichia coli]
AVFAVPAYGPQNDVTLKMPAFEWVHVQLHQQKGMISLSPPTICNSAVLLASGGIGMPALQAMLSRQVDEERQGQLQGSLAALTSLTSIVGPLLFTAIYAASITTWNGWAWIAGAALYLLCLPALRRGLWRNSSNS